MQQRGKTEFRGETVSLQDERQASYIAKFGSHIVTENDLLTELKYRTSWYFVRFAIERKLVLELLDEHGIDLEEEEVYEYMDAFREQNDLYSEKEIDGWLTLNNMDDDEFFEMCRYEASLKVLKKKLVPEEKIIETFAFRRLDLDAVELYQIVVNDLDLAEELLAQTKEGEAFFELAHKYSTDEDSKKTCGYMGLLRRSDLRAEISGAVFAAKNGTVLGPFKGTTGYHLYLVDRVIFAELNEGTRALFEEEYFQALLATKFRGAQIEYRRAASD